MLPGCYHSVVEYMRLHDSYVRRAHYCSSYHRTELLYLAVRLAKRYLGSGMILRIEIRNSVTFDRFRSALRTHYYRLAFDNN